jgi:hypothetical protein
LSAQAVEPEAKLQITGSSPWEGYLVSASQKSKNLEEFLAGLRFEQWES